MYRSRKRPVMSGSAGLSNQFCDLSGRRVPVLLMLCLRSARRDDDAAWPEDCRAVSNSSSRGPTSTSWSRARTGSRGASGPSWTVAVARGIGLEGEDLEDGVVVGVGGAGEGADLASDDALDGGDELIGSGDLEVHAGFADALLVAHRDHGQLGGQQRVFEHAHQGVAAGEVRARAPRAAPELLLVQRHHRAGDLRERGAALVLDARARPDS